MKAGLQALAWAGVVAGLAWQVRQHDTPLLRWLAPLVQAQDVAAQSAGETVTQTELDLALQQHLWRRGESLEALSSARQAEARSRVLGDLLDQKRVRRARAAEPARAAAQPQVQIELSRFARMLGFEDGRREAAWRAGLHSETSFERSVHDSLLDEHWLDGKLSVSIPFVQVTDWYHAHREQLRVPAAHHAAHLFLSRHEPGKPDRSAEMHPLAAQLTRGADWSTLVSEHSEDARTAQRGGDLGWFSTHRMPAAFMAAVQGLRSGQVSAPIETDLGWHIIKPIEARPARVPELPEVQAEIAAMLEHQAQEQAVAALLHSLHATPSP